MIMSKVLAISKTLPRTAIRDGQIQAGWGSRRATDLRQLSYASRQIQLRVTDRRAQASAAVARTRAGAGTPGRSAPRLRRCSRTRARAARPLRARTTARPAGARAGSGTARRLAAKRR